MSPQELLADAKHANEMPEVPIDQSKPNFYLIGLKGPLLEEWRKQINNLGVKLVTHIQVYIYPKLQITSIAPEKTRRWTKNRRTKSR